MSRPLMKGKPSPLTQGCVFIRDIRLPELPIWPHNEYGWSIVNPAWLNFSCLAVPSSGGETPIISSIRLANALQKKAPEFYKRLLYHGVRYIYRYGRE